jgi:hypothetical protein
MRTGRSAALLYESAAGSGAGAVAAFMFCGLLSPLGGMFDGVPTVTVDHCDSEKFRLCSEGWPRQAVGVGWVRR